MRDREFEEMIMRDIMSAVPPWKSPNAKPTVLIYRKTDSQEKIDKCLSCSKAECSNCLCGRKSKYVPKKKIATVQA